MVYVRKARHLRDYKLALMFDDGSRGVADLEPELTGVLAPLRDRRVFRHVRVENGTVSWRGGELDLAPSRLYALAHGLPNPSDMAAAQANEREVSLRQLRQIAGRSQVELAETIGISQAELSRFERRRDVKLASLRRYVEALGGKLEVSARLGGKRVVIHG